MTILERSSIQKCNCTEICWPAMQNRLFLLYYPLEKGLTSGGDGCRYLCFAFNEAEMTIDRDPHSLNRNWRISSWNHTNVKKRKQKEDRKRAKMFRWLWLPIPCRKKNCSPSDTSPDRGRNPAYVPCTIPAPKIKNTVILITQRLPPYAPPQPAPGIGRRHI